jgi:hypothetical protein
VNLLPLARHHLLIGLSGPASVIGVISVAKYRIRPEDIWNKHTESSNLASANLARRGPSMTSPPRPPAKPVRSLSEKYAAAQADLEKWSMLAAAPVRGATGTAASGLSPEASLFAKKAARGFARVVDVFEKALMRRNGNRLPKELEAKLAEISKLAAARQGQRE